MTQFTLKHSLFILFIALITSACLLFFGNNQATNQEQLTSSEQVEKKAPQILDVAIVGSGPAGLAAAQYAAGNTFNVGVFNGPNPGGYAATLEQINNWPGRPTCPGNVLMDELRTNAEKVKTQFIDESVTAINYATKPFQLTSDTGTVYQAHTIILATGTERKKPNVPGGEEYWGRGISPCSLCDSTSHIGKQLVVMGNNHHVINETLHLAKTAKEIYLFVSKKMFDIASQQTFPSHVHLVRGKVTAILGNGTTVTSVTYQEMGEEKTIDAHGVFVSLGDRPNSSLCKNGGPEKNKKGYIVTAPHSQATTVPGVYAAGDVCQPSIKQAIIADANGLRAAIEATKFINKK